MVPHGNHVHVGLGLEPEVRVYDLDGSLVRVIRWQQERIAFTDAVLDDLVRDGQFPVPAASSEQHAGAVEPTGSDRGTSRSPE